MKIIESIFKNGFTVSEDNDFIKLMSDRFHTNHHYCVITNQDLADALKDAVLLRDMPGMADVDSSLHWFCKEIKKILRLVCQVNVPMKFWRISLVLS